MVKFLVIMLNLSGVLGHGALLWPRPYSFTPPFLKKLPSRMRDLATHSESSGQDIPHYLLQSTSLEFWQQEGLPKPKGGAWSLPCKGVPPNGEPTSVIPGGTLRVKYMIDVTHGGDCYFGFFRLDTGGVTLLGRRHVVENCGERVNSGVWEAVKVPAEVDECTDARNCFIQFYWRTRKSVDGMHQTYVNCALIKSK